MVGIKSILKKKDFIIILILSIIFYLGMEVFLLLPNISGELTNIYSTLVFFIFLFGFPYLISKHLLKKGIKTAILLFILIYNFGIVGIVAIFGSNMELTKIIISMSVLVFSRITIFSIIYLTFSYIFNFFNTNADREFASRKVTIDSNFIISSSKKHSPIEEVLIEKELPENEIEFQDMVDKNRTIVTKSGIYVQSQGEKAIADFLYENSIDFEYDKQITFKHNEKNEFGYTKSWLRPDFWLPEHNLIIEFWGLKGESDYDKKMDWKKRVYAESKTTYISIEHKHLDNLNEILTKKLKQKGIPL
jgi:hypothetical protein